MAILTKDFKDELYSAIEGKYFPEIKSFIKSIKIQYTIEIYESGFLDYDDFIELLCILTNDNKVNIHAIVKMYVVDFGDYVYNY
jgi:hypothetical protein